MDEAGRAALPTLLRHVAGPRPPRRCAVIVLLMFAAVAIALAAMVAALNHTWGPK
ncbi:hypothetical protein [Streptomyces sp. MP131-18]|uniref:hypothetical protein n=1 Tax=Streptomyces sp. MP131-18 TaxID=1857892 RepID=UPI0015C56811|nr:hypothetical protein [Streptomyces sp. MP131-18]